MFGGEYAQGGWTGQVPGGIQCLVASMPRVVGQDRYLVVASSVWWRVCPGWWGRTGWSGQGRRRPGSPGRRCWSSAASYACRKRRSTVTENLSYVKRLVQLFINLKTIQLTENLASRKIPVTNPSSHREYETANNKL